MEDIKDHKNVQQIVKGMLFYSNNFINIKYVWWKGDGSIFDTNLLYCDGIPNLDIIQSNGINCTGFMNILRQYVGTLIPKDQHGCRGGTGHWYQYFKEKQVLLQFDYAKDYPLGTLFFRRYRNLQDQGHVSIYYEKYKEDPTKILYGKIIHAYADYSQQGGRVGITVLGYSHFYYVNSETIGYYQYAVLPQHWLFI